MGFEGDAGGEAGEAGEAEEAEEEEAGEDEAGTTAHPGGATPLMRGGTANPDTAITTGRSQDI